MSLILPPGAKTAPAPEPVATPPVAMVEPEKPKATIAEIIAGCTLRPYGPQVVILRDPLPTTAGQIVLPQADKNKAKAVQHGTVIRCGEGHRDQTGRLHPPPFTTGSRVVFAQYAGNDIPHPEVWDKKQVYTLMQQGEVLCGIDGDATAPHPAL